MTFQPALSHNGDSLSISIVAFHPDRAQFAHTLETLAAACDALHAAKPAYAIQLYLVDNGGLPDDAAAARTLLGRQIGCTVVTGHGNVGYGRGHNLAIERTSSLHHLVLNPDIDLSADALIRALDVLGDHPKIGLLSPRIGDEAGCLQYLCRRYPTVFDLFARGFLPSRLRAPFANRLARYEMRDVIGDKEVVWDPPIVSGCFMLFRTDVLKKLGGFDPRYFLYFEDYDLSLRTHEIARVAYVPSVRVLHHGGDAARKGWTHIKLFVTSAYKFFNRFGWKWL